MLRKFRLTLLLLTGALASSVASAEVLPPPPDQYVNDYAHVLSNAASLNGELDQFERDTSNQILVAIYPTMQSDSSIEDYTVRIANSWKAGGKKKDNGAILFVFIQDRKMFIQVGYGLEGALPDALCKQIIEQEIKPGFRQGDYSSGIAAGVHALMAAARGEYKGNGGTVGDSNSSDGRGNSIKLSPFWIFVIVLVLISFFRRSTHYGYYGRQSGWSWGPFILGQILGSMSSGGGGRDWGGGGGGGGGFRGGGGSFGGGGAGGSW